MRREFTTLGLMALALGAISIAPILHGTTVALEREVVRTQIIEVPVEVPVFETCPDLTCPEPLACPEEVLCPDEVVCPAVPECPVAIRPEAETAKWPDIDGPVVERYQTTLIPRGDWVGVGTRLGLVATDRGAVMVHEDRGVVGVVQGPPDTVWTGVDRTDQIWAATADGTLWSSPDGENFRVKDQVVGASLWDLNGRQLIAASDSRLVVIDGGTRHEAVPEPDATYGFVGSQGEGVAVAQTDSGTTYVTTDGGGSWRQTKAPENLTRTGSWIRGTEKGDAALTARGSWSTALSWRRASRGYAWFSGRGSLHEGRVYYQWDAPLPTWEDPSPARKGNRYDAGEPVPTLSIDAWIKDKRDCTGATCLHYTWTDTLPNSPARFGFFRNGTCDSDNYSCEADDRTNKTPTFAVLDHRDDTLSIGLPPASCHTPRSVRTVAGAGLVVCDRGDETDLWMVDAGGQWFLETTLDVPAETLTMHWGSTTPFWGSIKPSVGADGTLLLHIGRPCDEDVPALVRAPLPLGSQGAWRWVETSGARTWRVGVEGEIYGFIQPDRDDPHGLQIIAVDGDGETSIVDEIQLENDLIDAYVGAGRVALETARLYTHTWHLVEAGALIDDFDMDIPETGHGAGVECPR